MSGGIREQLGLQARAEAVLVPMIPAVIHAFADALLEAASGVGYSASSFLKSCLQSFLHAPSTELPSGPVTILYICTVINV